MDEVCYNPDTDVHPTAVSEDHIYERQYGSAEFGEYVTRVGYNILIHQAMVWRSEFPKNGIGWKSIQLRLAYLMILILNIVVRTGGLIFLIVYSGSIRILGWVYPYRVGLFIRIIGLGIAVGCEILSDIMQDFITLRLLGLSVGISVVLILIRSGVIILGIILFRMYSIGDVVSVDSEIQRNLPVRYYEGRGNNHHP